MATIYLDARMRSVNIFAFLPPDFTAFKMLDAHLHPAIQNVTR